MSGGAKGRAWRLAAAGLCAGLISAAVPAAAGGVPVAAVPPGFAANGMT
jgi:hypothetical protein